MKIRKNKGFTIVELVIVIGVIGILSAILIPTFVSLTANARTVREQSDAANVYSMYAAEAADGWIDVETGEPAVQIHLKGQQEVLITKFSSGANRYFTFDGKNWKGADAAPAVATIVSTATSWENVAYTLDVDGETEIGNDAGSKFNVVSDSEYFLVQYAK